MECNALIFCSVGLYSLLSVLVVSLISLIGVVTFKWASKELKPFLLILVSFAAGALLGDVFIHLLPEIIEEKGEFGITISLAVLSGFLIFFILEKFVHWHHCHYPQEHEAGPSHLAYMNIFGDGLHNFIDGMIIAGSYLVSIPVGIATTVAVILHEIPQEISDFGVLIHSGLTRRKALWFNFLSALMSVIGAVFVLAIGMEYENIMSLLAPFTVGAFLYIAGSDLIPELHKETNPLSSVVQLFSFVSGIAVMFALLLIET